jgi:integrase/recombinase XerD
MTFARIAGGDEAKWPWAHRQAFVEGLRAQGYSRFTLRQYELIAGSFCAKIEKRGLAVGNLDGATTERLRRAVVKEIPEYIRTWGKFCVGRFIEHLAEAGVATLAQSSARRSTALDRLRDEYETYLRRQPGLADSTIYHCTRFLERFIAFRFGDRLGDLKAITPDDIVAFLCKLKAGSKPWRQKALPSHLRNLFKFLFWSGKTKRNLADGLPRVALSIGNLPRYLKAEEIQRLVESARTNDAIGRRNYAMFLLMARLGLSRGGRDPA